ncbi:uncharacterized protein C16orf46 homolog [Suricata suricatta]|uniref:uncharacterized protein C16orf46 homolog n=1 Tax=Suricata suricatta TaxID=37032 RepID=UPI0011559277|nr:uncharacterized protein C16orf46 homolog [Suricata suricatta]
MDLCQENEAELENSANKETQSPEETELTYTCPDERSEKSHVRCLLNISDITLEQDEKASDFVIRTGWEEAVSIVFTEVSHTSVFWCTSFLLLFSKIGITKDNDVLGKKSKNSFLQREEKVLSMEKDAWVACAYGLKTVDGKGEKGPVELAKHPKANDTLPFPPRAAPAPLLADHQRDGLHWSLRPAKRPVCPPNPGNGRYLAPVQLWQKQGVQNIKARFKAREPRPAVNIQKHILAEAKQENRPQTLTKVLRRTLLPSLTVSRVVTPVSAHRLL